MARLVTTQQAISQGFSDAAKSLVGAGNITISLGGGDLRTQTKLNDLNGGKGVQRGSFRLTDRSGKTANIDISTAVTLDDVAKKINSSLDVSVKATVGKNGLTLTDLTGQTTGTLTVQESGDGTTAEDLGILGAAVGTTLTGTSVNSIGANTGLSGLNDGRGVGTATNAGADFRVLAGDGSLFDVSLKDAKTVGDVLDAVNAASNGKVRAEVPVGGGGIRLTDTSGGGSVTVANLNSSTAAADLGIQGTGAGGITGTSLIAGIDSTLISSLNGGSGLSLGTVAITDRSGASQNIDLSGAKSVTDILDAINSQTDGSGVHSIKVTASLNASGNGIQLVDKSGGTGDVHVSDVDSTTAQALGINGTFDKSKTVINGSNLHRQFVTTSSVLKDYNGGKGVALGKFKITNSAGLSAEVDLQAVDATKVADVLSAINNLHLGVTAAVNQNGNGIQLTDTAGGTGQVKVSEDGSTTAGDLNLLGTAVSNKIDGAFEKTIAVTATDNLNTIATRINSLGFGVTASVINDGSADAPFRLSLNATNTGRDGRFVFDGGATKLATTNLVEAQDAAVFIGGQGGTNPLLVTSSKNQLANVIKGVTIDLHGTSTSPVTLNITRDSSNISTQLKNFVDGYNAISTKITTLTKFDTKTNTGALLLGDGTTQAIEQGLATLLNSVVSGAGKYRILAQLGITVDDKNQLSFDSTKFDSAYATDQDSVKTLFSKAGTGFGTLISKTIDKLTDPVTGLITVQTKTLDNRTQGFQDQVTLLNSLLGAKKTRLQKQFANLESVLSGLQSQQQSLSTLTGVTQSIANSTKTSSSSSASAG